MRTIEQIEVLKKLANLVDNDTKRYKQSGFMCSNLNCLVNDEDKKILINLLWETRIKSKVKDNNFHTLNGTKPFVWYNQGFNVSNAYRLKNINRAIKKLEKNLEESK